MAMTTRRSVLALASAPVLLRSREAAAQEAWPSRPVRLLVPYSTGGSTDVVARLLADLLSQRLPQRVVVENRTGGGGTIAASATARSDPDGSTLFFTNVGYVASRSLNPRLDFDPDTDLRPVTIATEGPMVMLVGPNSPFQSVRDLVEAARARPGQYSYGSSGGGGALQLTALGFLRATRIEMNEVGYRGSGQALPDLSAGRLDMMFDSGVAGFPLARAGHVRALAVSSPRRSAVMPDLPTLAEAGFPAATFSLWQMLMAPATTPPALMARINQAFVTAITDPAIHQRLTDLGAERIVANGLEEAQAYFSAEMARWAEILGTTAQRG
jgi:tripartite-type tricarboxylate transporter receptor subunit TctC